MFQQSRLLSTFNQSARWHLNEIELHDGHEIAICHNPPTHSFAGDVKNLTSPWQINT
jgi:hypothetical protein